MEYVIFYAFAVLAGFKSMCPQGGRPPCPDPVAKALFGFITGAIAAVAYFFLFIGSRALECCDLIAVSILAYLFSHFIWAFFFTKKER